MLTDEQIVLSARPIGGLFDDLAVHYQSDDIVKFGRAIEAEVRKDDDALIRQMLEALKAGLKEVIATGENEGVLFGPDQHVDAKLQAAISAATARLEKAP